MWNQGCQSTGGITSHKAVLPSKATLQILPCTVSQLLSAPQVGSDTFTICDWELHQVSIVGIIRGTAPFVTNIQYSVDDMTGPPLSVKQWVNTEASGISIDCAPLSFAAPGTYVKVIGSLRSFSGQRSLLAMDIRCIEDLNEITSHMMEVVQAHMQLFGKGFDVNMNPTTGGHHDRMIPNSLSTIQGQVLDVIRQISVHDTDISFHGLKTQLQDLSMSDIRAGKPPPGLHLDVVKGDKLVEKLIIDEKKYYLFGRNPDVCDFTIDHQSCSRIHSALVYHKHLKRVFIIDLNSTHGTFLGRIRLEPQKPQQVPIDSTMSFGASTRVYILREKPQTQGSGAPGELKAGEDEELKGLLGLPEEETELNNLTEFNTAHNKRISTLTIEDGNLDIPRPKRRRRSSRVSFSDDEEVINPEDIDPSVGRFRNMVQTAVVPIKKKKSEDHGSPGLEAAVRRMQSSPVGGGLYGDLPPTTSHEGATHHHAATQGAATILGGMPALLPNLAPEVDVTPAASEPPVTLNSVPAAGPFTAEPLNEPRKKKYAKEAWPGKKPTPSLLI